MFKNKTAILSGVSIVILMFAISGCYKTTTLVVNPGSNITVEQSFAKDITPIFDKSCALSGCHMSGAKSPDLSSGNAYKSLNDGRYFIAGDPDNSVLIFWLTGKKFPAMPMGTGLNQEINAKVYAWIKQGAKNN